MNPLNKYERYGDGMNLYQYLGSNPWTRSDPMGLSYDPFDAVDDYLGEASGATAAFLSQLGQSAAAVGVIAATIASYLPFPFVGNLGDMALYALGEQTGGELAAGIAIGLIPGGKLLHKLGGSKVVSFLGRIGVSAWSAATKYAAKIGRRILGAIGGAGRWLAERAQRFVGKACTCFEAGTVVWTDRGLIAIEEVQPGDFVIAEDETKGEATLKPVLRTLARFGAPIVTVLVLNTSDLSAQQLDTTEEHPFYVEGKGWAPTQALVPGDALRTTSGQLTIVTEVQFTSRLGTVYNFEVEGLHNYRVGASGVLVHNSGNKLCPWPKPRYMEHPHHRYRSNKTPLPNDAEDVYERAVFADGKMWGQSADGKFYVFHIGSGDGPGATAHFSRIEEHWRKLPSAVAEYFGLR